MLVTRRPRHVWNECLQDWLSLQTLSAHVSYHSHHREPRVGRGWAAVLVSLANGIDVGPNSMRHAFINDRHSVPVSSRLSEILAGEISPAQEFGPNRAKEILIDGVFYKLPNRWHAFAFCR